MEFLKVEKSKIRPGQTLRSGVDLRAINKTEAEVLFKPFTKYKLMDIKPSEANPDV